MTIPNMERQVGASLLEDDMPSHTMPDGAVHPGATHEEYEQIMAEEAPIESEEIVPDGEMEEDYVDFIISKALDSDEKEFLINELAGNDKLSIIFDKVVGVASEFSGEGSVEGPGTEVSDSIPARLSEGEFVFTAKAVEEIGVDTLMAIMNEAETNADERQSMATGGLLSNSNEDETRRSYASTMGSTSSLLDEGLSVSAEIKKRMMDPFAQAKHVRS